MEDKIRNLVFEVLHKNVPLIKITNEANLADDLGLDSLMFVTLVGGIESEFNIALDPDNIIYKFFNSQNKCTDITSHMCPNCNYQDLQLV